MKRKRKEKVDKMKMCDDWCFVCKDGGSLFICEYEDCLKSYHAECAGKTESFFEREGLLKCEWHSCLICRKRPKYQCYCCPKAFCERCIVDAEFAKVRGNKGFCTDCLKVLLLGEEQREVDSDGEQVDMKDRNTYECLLYEFWLVIKEKENLSIKDLYTADKFFKSFRRGEILSSFSNPSGSDKYADESLRSTSEDSGSEFSITPLTKGKRSKGQKASSRKEVKSKKLEFVGWGSKPLIDFLVSIGRDTSKEISENDIASIINGYIRENKLFNPEKKKKIVSDERLHALFGKKIFMRNNISTLLQLHFRENAEFYEQDQLDYGSGEESENEITVSKKKKIVTSKKPHKKEVVIEPPRSCFASVNMENIKLIYLKRCLVMELLKEPESFESKIIGSFVKVKSDPYDMQRNAHQLVQVTGVKNASPGRKEEDILLQVSNRFNDFPISMLSNAILYEEECEDLRERVKSGQLKKLTIVELEEKAKSLHLLIMNHWIVKELASLQIKIDTANEKGQRADTLFKYMEKKGLLETEKIRLLEEVPKVIADIPEIEPIPDNANKELKHGDGIPPKSIISGNSKGFDKILGDNIASTEGKAAAGDNFMTGKTESISANYKNGTTKGDQFFNKIQDSDEEESVCNDQFNAMQRRELRQCGSEMQIQSNDVEQKTAKTEDAVLIELSSDEDNENGSSISLRKKEPEDLDAPIWHCLGPYGERKGPFSLSFLKRWSDSRYALKNRVWKTGESEENAIPLSDAVSQFCWKD